MVVVVVVVVVVERKGTMIRKKTEPKIIKRNTHMVKMIMMAITNTYAGVDDNVDDDALLVLWY